MIEPLGNETIHKAYFLFKPCNEKELSLFSMYFFWKIRLEQFIQ